MPPSTDSNATRLVVGLGNPGPDYEGTRHNVGFELLDRLARDHHLDWSKERKFKAMVAKEGNDQILVKPLTYMNLSGESVAKFTGFYKIPATKILIVYDDVDLPVGSMRFRASGSSGGHNGIKSIIQSLGHDGFPRLKIGVGSASKERGMVDHVLGKFDPEEQEEIEKTLAIAVDAVNCSLAFGVEAAMNRFNQKAKTAKKNQNQHKQTPENDQS